MGKLNGIWSYLKRTDCNSWVWWHRRREDVISRLDYTGRLLKQAKEKKQLFPAFCKEWFILSVFKKVNFMSFYLAGFLLSPVLGVSVPQSLGEPERHSTAQERPPSPALGAHWAGQWPTRGMWRVCVPAMRACRAWWGLKAHPGGAVTEALSGVNFWSGQPLKEETLRYT